MRNFTWVCLAVLLAGMAFGAPSLVLMDRKDVTGQVSVLRELRDEVFAAAETAELAKAGVAYILIDEGYLPGHYLLLAPRDAREKRLAVLWQDKRRAVVKFDSPVSEWEGPHERLEQEPARVRDTRPAMSLDDPALDLWLTQLAAQVNADTLLANVTTLASYNRYARWTSNDNAAAWVRSRFQGYGYDSVYYHAFTAHSGSWSRTANNIIAVIPGTASPDSIVLIGGHMDATSENTTTGAPGADDNGSGASAVIEAARLLANVNFRHTVMLVCFNAEEQGMQGSVALANLMASQGKRVIAALTMDMIGYYVPANQDMWIEGFYSGTNSEWLMDTLAYNCTHFSSLIPYIYPQDGFGSDHVSFHSAGYPAVLAIEYEYEDYPCYHLLCDLPNRVTASYMRNMASVVILTSAELAQPLGTGSITGTVTLQGSSNAAGVIAAVVGGGARDTTDAAGAYQLTGLLPGTYAVAFSKAGWVSDTLTGIVVTDGNENGNQNISLLSSPPGSVAGTVTLSGGSGVVTNAIVYVDNVLAHPNGSGQYSINPVFAGQHAVTAALNGYALGSQVVTLADGQQMSGVNITLYPQWDLEASNYGLDAHASGWAWGTDATAGYHSATRVWGTVLGANYSNCVDYILDMPAVSLANLDSAKLTFWHWYNIEPNGATQPYDGANVSVSPLGSSVWTVITPVGGYPGNAGGTCNPIQSQAAYDSISPGWVQAVFNLNAYIGQTIRVRYRLGTDQAVTRRGWYLDDIALQGFHHIQAFPPNAVANLTVLSTDEGVSLQWSPTANAVRYRIYRGTSYDQPLGSMSLLATQTGTSYLDTSGTTMLIGFYVVIAEN